MNRLRCRLGHCISSVFASIMETRTITRNSQDPRQHGCLPEKMKPEVGRDQERLAMIENAGLSRPPPGTGQAPS